MAYVYMKVLESAPARYDRGMQLLTLGRLNQVHHDIANRIHDGEAVLDLGCGTGTLAALLAERGANVTAVDISPAMLDLAAQRLRTAGLEEQVTLRERGVVELDTFPDASFDAITSTLVFSELSGDEIAYGLAECHRILRPGGRLLVADEVLPESPLGRVATFLFRLPFVVLAFLLTQNTTHRVAGLQERIEAHGFRITAVQRYLVGTLRLFVAQKARAPDADARSTGALTQARARQRDRRKASPHHAGHTENNHPDDLPLVSLPHRDWATGHRPAWPKRTRPADVQL